MSIESGSRRQHHEDDERRDGTALNMPETPAYDTDDTPPRPDDAPTPSGYFDKEDTADRGWLRSGRTRLLASVAAGSVLAGGIFIGVGLSDKEAKDPAPKAPGIDAPVTPGEEAPSPSASEADGSYEQFKTKAEYYPTIYDTPLYKELDPAEQHEVEKLEEMSYDVFRKLPYDQQIAYADFYYRAYEEYGREQVERSIYYQKDTPQTVTKESSGQDILNDFAARQSTIFYSIAEEGIPYRINENNREEAKKALTLVYPDRFADSQIYTNRIDQLSNLEALEADEESPYNGDGYPVRKADRESGVGYDLDKLAKYINVQDTDGEYQQYVFNYTTYKDIRGEERSVWQLNMILGEEHSMYKPDVENVFK